MPSSTQEFAAGSLHGRIKPGVFGSAKIVHDSPDEFTRLRAAMHGQPLDCDVYTRLFINDCLWMTDADFEWRTNLGPVYKMSGDVLIAGLGLGFIVLPILNRDSVTSVTVLERSADVIALVEPQIKHGKLTIIQVDARTWQPPKNNYDCVYLDIWSDVPNSDNLEEIKALKKKYRPALRKGGWVSAWCEDWARR